LPLVKRPLKCFQVRREICLLYGKEPNDKKPSQLQVPVCQIIELPAVFDTIWGCGACRTHSRLSGAEGHSNSSKFCASLCLRIVLSNLSLPGSSFIEIKLEKNNSSYQENLRPIHKGNKYFTYTVISLL
jgi:hypothetical protein